MSFASWIFCLIYTSWYWQYIDFIFYLLCIIILSRACLQKLSSKFACIWIFGWTFQRKIWCYLLSPGVDRKICFIFPVCLLYKELKMVDMFGIFCGMSDMVNKSRKLVFLCCKCSYVMKPYVNVIMVL